MMHDQKAQLTNLDKCSVEVLWDAAYRNNIDGAKMLIDAGVNVNSHDDTTPLFAASLAGHTSMARFLLQHGANVHLKSEGDETVLHYAVEYGYEQVAELLIQEGVEVNAVDVKGQTALHYAASKGRKAMMTFLLHHKADGKLKDVAEQSAWDVLKIWQDRGLSNRMSMGNDPKVDILHFPDDVNSCALGTY
jgi:ankyrin repeat protein